MPITLSRQQLADLYRQSRGFGENALSMLTGGIGEPVAGFASLAALARGENAAGVRDAVRDAFTYQPRTAEGQGQQRMLGELAQSAMNSAPVRTWQRGVDFAGRASPVAGATLQMVPTALGALTGYKPAMQTGQAVSRALAQAQRVAMENAMRPRVLHPQAGAINAGGSARELTPRQLKAYELGKKHREILQANPEMTYEDLVWQMRGDEDTFFREIASPNSPMSYGAYESGRRGGTLPKISKGYRYGNPPSSGYSHNFVDGRNESGVSMAKVDGVDFNWVPMSEETMRKIPKEYEGWLLDPEVFWGSDGEPLMLNLRPTGK